MELVCHAVLVAAGRSVRFGADKLALRLDDGETVLFHSARCLLEGGVAGIVIVGTPGPEHGLERLGTGILAVVPGGSERVESVRHGLAALPADTDLVAIHDGARPFCSPDLIRRLQACAAKTGAAVPVLPSPDSLLRVNESGEPIGVVVRDEIRRVQTPQVARRDWLTQALDSSEQVFTDESSALLLAGFPVTGVPGEETNIKITQPSDLPTPCRRTVVGQGFDVHRYDEERPLHLGGCTFPNEVGLAGHSDADVLIHALVDALLGAIGGGDIGEHFPPSDERWAGVESVVFLTHALEQVAAAQGRLEHVDLCLIGEQPRLAPYKAEIRQRLSQLLALPMSAVNLKATTTERLGFTGRREGLAAQALATVTLPPLGGPSVE